MPSTRVIKKYPNRRLYDTNVSRYITLADVRGLVVRHVPFRVVDSVNEADITRSILLQILVEDEAGGQPMFNATMLTQLICFCDGNTQGMFARHLEDSLVLFAKQQDQEPRVDGSREIGALPVGREREPGSDLRKDYMRVTGLHVSDCDRGKDRRD